MELLQLIDEKTFVAGDTHLFHENILHYYPSRRGYLFEGKPSHEDWLIDNWNSVVGENDLVIHLGDFSFKPHLYAEWAQFLNGRKILICGNHDGKDCNLWKSYLDTVIGGGEVLVVTSKGIKRIKTDHFLANGLVVPIKGKKVMFTHYPIIDNFPNPISEILREIFHREECDLNIHGHVHENTIPHPQLFNASVENIGFKPIRVGEILKTLEGRI